MLKSSLAAIAPVAVVVTLLPSSAGAENNPASPGAGPRPLTSAEAARLSAHPDRPVVVLLRDQPKSARRGTRASTARTATVARLQAPVVSELAKVHARHVRTYQLVNAVAGTVSTAEAARLSADPAVAAVIPDGLIKGGSLPVTGAGASAAPPDTTTVCPAPGRTMLEPEALSVTHTDSDDPTAATARSLGFDGSGVKVAYLAEGIDINNPDFIRANGQHVFADYQDFTGDGPNAPTSGGEAFIDASAIAAQGRQVYNVQNFGAHPLPTACDIRIEGMAPGASLYGFKVFGENDYSTTSGFLQAIQWATAVDHVDVINESFGVNPFPDSATRDAVKMFDDAAIAAGVTVTVSTGDAGTTNTQGSPSTDPKVIATGASTTFRWYAQTDYGLAQQFATNGWLNDNVSSLSSSGFNQAGRSIDLLAPGDSSFALCTPNTDIYGDCVDFNGSPSPVERSGGTSESAPLTAGAAALVIQAYRHSHGGASPTPALVKQILVSTADDLTVPADEQGAGRLNTYKAVQAALSVHDANGSPAATGSTLLVNKTQLDATGAPGTRERWRVKVTNTGAAPQTVRMYGRQFGPPQDQTTGTVTLSDASSPKVSDWSGVANNYGSLTFSVPAGRARLDASIAYPGDPNASLNARVRLVLIDPLGRYAAHSLPQGVGNYGNVDVRFPAAGTWQAIIFSRTSANGGTLGTVHFQESTQDTGSFGWVSPSTRVIAPGHSIELTVFAVTPAQPGDASGALVLDAGSGGQTSVPVMLRSTVRTGHHGGQFSGVLTGGNGRQTDVGQTNYYVFDVRHGQRDLSTSIGLDNAADTIVAYLVDPRGNVMATGANTLATSFNPQTRDGTLTALTHADLYVRDPMRGRWTLAVNFAGAVRGDMLSEPFTGTIGFNTVDVTAPTLPDSSHTTLAAGTPVTVPVTVKNTGAAPVDVFLDPRLRQSADQALAAVEPATVPLPVPGDAPSPAWTVPSETTAVTVAAAASLPVMFDFGPEAGDPDVASAGSGMSVSGSIVSRHSLPAGLWAALPDEIGPTPANGAPAGVAQLSMTASTKVFDPTITSVATDFWRTSVTPQTSMTIVTVAPGQTLTVPMTITPSGAPGTVVHGDVYVDQFVAASSAVLNDFNFADPADLEATGNELAALPYHYKIG